MNTIYLIWPDKTREKWIKEGIEKYFLRLKHYSKPVLIEFKTPKNLRNKSAPEFKREEGDLIKARLPKGYVISLDERGKQMTTVEFSSFLQKLMDRNIRDIIFIVGGDAGLSEDILTLSDSVFSLSGLTFPHEIARLLLVEQLYRAFTVMNNEPYHH
jgi:23S rRNA (pseudouridine1915-N3)-methyltransferase